MASKTLAYATPDVLRWARESTGYSVSDAAGRIGVPWWRLEAAEAGADYLTLRQAEKAAKAYQRPLATLFLPSAPTEEPQEAQFRRLPGAPSPPWPPEMRLLARRIRRRQQRAAEIYELLDDAAPWLASAKELRQHDLQRLRHSGRSLFVLPLEEQTAQALSSDRYSVLRTWVDAVEELGVLVMQDGSLPLELMRGFAALDPDVPAVVLNNKDDPRARSFTLVHEFGHLVLQALGDDGGPEGETWCNDFAGSVLMPSPEFEGTYADTQGSDVVERIDELARQFGVTPLAAAVRLGRLAVLSSSASTTAIERIRGRAGAGPSGTGGNYYVNTVAEFGPTYLRLVFEGVDSAVLTYPTASGLLENVKVNNFDRLRETLARRTEG